MRIEDTLRESADARFLVAGDLVLDRQDQRAWLSSSALDVGSKALVLLDEMMSQPGLLVTKDRLFQVGWPDQATSDAVLTTAIRELRRALGDAARQPEWIETHHGKGYRFLKPVEVRAVHPGRQSTATPADASPRQAVRAKWTWALVAILLVAIGGFWLFQSRTTSDAMDRATETQSLARVVVLPFVVENGEEWLGGAMSSRLTDVLQNSPGLFVADHEMAQRFAIADDVLAAAQDEKFQTLISGAVRLKDGRLHVDVKVQDAKGSEIWSRSLVDDEENLIALTERVAFEVARALTIASDPEMFAEMARIGTRSLPAFEAYSRASQTLDSLDTFRNPGNMRSAIDNLERAVALDPTFGRASATLAWFTFPGPFSDDAPQAEAKGLALLEMAARYASSDWDRRLSKAQLNLRLLKLGQARADLEGLYAETRKTSSELNHSILIMLRQIGVATRDQKLIDFAWREMTEYNLARGRIQMANPHAIAHSRRLLDQYAAYQEQQDPTPIGDYARHTALLLAGRVEDAEQVSTSDIAMEDPSYSPVMTLSQACASGDIAGARAIARRVSALNETSPYMKWRLAQIAGLGDLVDRFAPKPTSEAGQRTLFGMLGEPGFDPNPFPLIAKAMKDAGVEAKPLPRPEYYCPMA